MKKLISSGIGLLLLASPLIASADVASQIQALLAQIQQLQAILAQLKAAQTGGGTITTGFCHVFSTDLQVGDGSGDMQYLHQTLKAEGFNSGDEDNSGRFGNSTFGAVKAFQAKYGIKQTGYVGPLTRGQLNKLYRCATGAGFSATPTSGAVPLSVTFSASRGGDAVGYYIDSIVLVDFGDGAYTDMTNASDAKRVTHVYANSGTYTAKLMAGGCRDVRYGGTGNCAPTLHQFGTATITVTSSQTQGTTFSATPTYGAAPLTIEFNSLASGTVDFGDGSSGAMNALPTYVACPAGTCPGYRTTHTYQSTGTYTAKLYNYNPNLVDCHGACPPPVGAVTVAVTGSQGASFTATPTSGASPLTVSFQIYGSAATLDYGDGTSVSVATLPVYDCLPSATHCPNNSATHTYTSPGTYTAQLLNNNQCIAAGCNVASTVTITVTSAQSQGITFSATPLSGTAPLPVSFTMNPGSAAPSTFMVDFGDGSTGTLNAASVCATCAATYVASHSYASAGTYSASLKRTASAGGATVSIVTITVSNPQASAQFTATPTSGTAPLSVEFNSNVAGSVNFGDGTNGTMNALPTYAACGTSCPGYRVTHTYQSVGTYSAQLLNSNQCTSASCTVLGSATITVSTSQQPPSTISVTTDAPSYATHAVIHATWSNTGTVGAQDWVGIVPTNGTWPGDLGVGVNWQWVNGVASGSANLTAPSSPGSYQVAYFLYTRDANGNFIEKARSASFTVTN